LGTVSLLCFLLAWALRLNQPIILTVSWLAYPLQFLCLLPFYALGARLFGGPAMTLSLGELLERVRTAPWAFLHDFWWVGLHGIAVWALLGVLIVPALWAAFRALLIRVVPAQA
jgi:hypothetical protein